jgi:hypothetical protein
MMWGVGNAAVIAWTLASFTCAQTTSTINTAGATKVGRSPLITGTSTQLSQQPTAPCGIISSSVSAYSAANPDCKPPLVNSSSTYSLNPSNRKPSIICFTCFGMSQLSPVKYRTIHGISRIRLPIFAISEQSGVSQRPSFWLDSRWGRSVWRTITDFS